MSKVKWNALYTSMFDAIQDIGDIRIVVKAWNWCNDGEADIAWQNVALLQYRATDRSALLQPLVVEQGLVAFDLEQTNEVEVIRAAVHKWEELLAKYTPPLPVPSESPYGHSGYSLAVELGAEYLGLAADQAGRLRGDLFSRLTEVDGIIDQNDLTAARCMVATIISCWKIVHPDMQAYGD